MTKPAPYETAGRLRWRVLAAALTVAAVVCLLMWASTTDRGAPVRPGPGTGTSSARPTSTQTVASTPPAPPVALSIPRIDVQTSLLRLGLRPDGGVEVPGDPALAGWYRRGPPPGARGSSVILGHVDSTSGPAVFYRLKELRPGDRVIVRLDDGTDVRFRVHSVQTYANADFPARQVYGARGPSVLNLVTCGGAYDPERGGYQSNVVVNARRV